MNNLSQLEALLFVAGDEGLSMNDLAQATGFDRAAMPHLLEQLEQRYNQVESGLSLRLDQERYVLVTKPALGPVVNRLFISPVNDKLTQPQLETLVIIAYQQPATRVEIEQIRGVSSAGTLQKLLLYRLIAVGGRRDEIGRPLEYVTTPEFLDYFGLENLADLPDLPDITELNLADSQLDPQDLFQASAVEVPGNPTEKEEDS
ncbi:SMC-Scp complex subunit ScpB [Convivina intestini]|uniref:SMC-Scp complex subunit ScpB n=1 Tax=Convivina intestini TaxID=1505726 RepID=UPI00200DAAFE|nr:SMC-Scp complex subunit ScpB [Convivina intestini]CAH1852328.1 Segregation and condensation protein B [Convivina intestini]